MLVVEIKLPSAGTPFGFTDLLVEGASTPHLSAVSCPVLVGLTVTGQLLRLAAAGIATASSALTQTLGAAYEQPCLMQEV